MVEFYQRVRIIMESVKMRPGTTSEAAMKIMKRPPQ